jgi:hypothetical protein
MCTKWIYGLLLLTLMACQQKTSKMQTVLQADSMQLFVFLNLDCPICQKYQGQFKSIEDSAYTTYYVFPGQSQNKQLSHWMQYNQIDPAYVIQDSNFVWTDFTKASNTPEGILYHREQVIYRGLLTDQFRGVGAFQSEGHINYVHNALNSLRQHVPIQNTKPVGCFIEPH